MVSNNNPRILVTGKDGQVGFALQQALAPVGTVVAIGRQDCDLLRPEAICATVNRFRPDIIVNPAAYTSVDKAEADLEPAFAVNALASQVFAEEAARTSAMLVHYSTDYVFDGRKSDPYTEQDETGPQSIYGKSKLAGEDAIRASGCRHLILRTSWVFGTHGGNFLKTILRLASERSSLGIVADQYGAPTSASLIAKVTAEMLRQLLLSEPDVEEAKLGTYHLTAGGETSWHGYAQHVVRLATELGMPLRLRAEDVVPIATADYPLPAPRPANSRLSTEKLQGAFNITFPHWQTGVAETLSILTK